MKKMYLLGVTLFGAAMTVVPAASASAATLELGLAIDDSGSISSSQFLLQRNGYVAALSDPTVVPLDGSVAIGVVKFATNVTTVFTMAQITSANIGTLIAAIQGMSQTGGSTNIAGAINSLTSTIFTNNIQSDRQVIDVSTDGDNNIGNLANARANALAAGIDQINCIGIGGSANCGPVVGGTGSFQMTATFDNFEESLKRKIQREVTGAVPEPASWAMFISGFGLLGFAMRRSRKVTVRFA